MNCKVKKYFFFYFLFHACIAFTQTDTNQLRGTIKISKHKDSTYIQAYATFKVFPEQSKKSDISYMTYVQWVQASNPSYAGDRIKITDPVPINGKFDYTAYFQNNVYSKNIKMREGECDTVNFFVTVDKSGTVNFRDILPVEKLGDATVVYSDMSKRKYKVDVSHVKTSYALEGLEKIKWIPAKIQRLKPHPSKHKEKYTSSEGYAQGILTVIYSSSPFKEQ